MAEKRPIIMVIEDETLLLRAIVKKLSLNDIDTISCTGGKQAIDYLSNTPELPDVIWLDFYLKDMNGMDFMKLLQADPRWSKIPVIVVSNSGSDDHMQSMLASGVKKYLIKANFRLEDLITIFKNAIGIHEPKPTNTA